MTVARTPKFGQAWDYSTCSTWTCGVIRARFMENETMCGREQTLNNTNREEKRTPLNMCYIPFIGKQYAPKILFLPRSSEEKNRLKGITPKVPHLLSRNYKTPTDLSREEHF